MITTDEILAIINRCAIKDRWNSVVNFSDFPKMADKIHEALSDKLVEWKVERAELIAKVKVYESIIENSSFKMAVVRKGDNK